MWRARVQKKREHPTPWLGTNFQVPFWTSSTDSPTLGYTKEEQIAQWRNRKCKQLRRQASVQIGSNCKLLFPWKLGQIAHWRNGKCKQLRRQASVQIVGNCELLFSWKLEQIAHRRNGKCKQLRQRASVQIGGDCEFFFSWKLRQIVRRRNGKCKQLTQQVSLQIISDCELLFSSFQIEVACLRACLMSLGKILAWFWQALLCRFITTRASSWWGLETVLTARIKVMMCCVPKNREPHLA